MALKQSMSLPGRSKPTSGPMSHGARLGGAALTQGQGRWSQRRMQLPCPSARCQLCGSNLPILQSKSLSALPLMVVSSEGNGMVAVLLLLLLLLLNSPPACCYGVELLRLSRLRCRPNTAASSGRLHRCVVAETAVTTRARRQQGISARHSLECAASPYTGR